MSDRSLQHDFDDELLSAYLDDELAPEERALVETRLAADPAARHMLDELRHVSQSIRGLPQESARGDLQESILRRAKAANRAAGADSKEPRRTVPMFTIGRTRRGWIWASLAVAAGLLIMFTQRDADENEVGKSIAQRRHDPPSLTAGPKAESEELAFPASGRLADSEMPSAPVAGGGGASTATRPDSAVGFAAAPSPESIDLLDEEQLVVVHVVAKREAIQNRAFDQLLVNNGVAVDPQTREKILDERAVEGRAGLTRSVGDVAANQPADAEEGVDVVLVEAPTQTIVSCLADLNRDHANYLGVSVDDSAPAEATPALQTPPANKLAAELGKYSRGMVPQRQKDLFAPGTANYYQQAADGTAFDGGRGGSLDAAGELKQEAQLRSARDNFSYPARAQRVLVENNKDRQAGKLRNLGRPLKAGDKSAADNLQVLFVLAPGDEPAASGAAEPTASPATENPTE